MAEFNPQAQPFQWQTKPTTGVWVGQRCRVFNDRNYEPADFRSFLEKFGSVSPWPVGRDRVIARAYQTEGVEIIELSGHRAVASPEDLDLLQRALEQVRRDVASAMTTGARVHFELGIVAEFAFLRLPPWLTSNLAAGVIEAALPLSAPGVVALTNDDLRVEFAKEGALKSLHDYIDKQFRAAVTGARLDRIATSSPMYAPWTLVVLLLATWFFPLDATTLLAAIAAMTVPIIVLAFQARDTGWRLYLARPGAITAIALYSISLFGVAYGLCALSTRSPDQVVTPEPLGNSFLIATSMGLAGGVVGDALSGPALRVAHAQLLLFLGGLTMLLARILRIEAMLSDRQ